MTAGFAPTRTESRFSNFCVFIASLFTVRNNPDGHELKHPDWGILFSHERGVS